MLLVRDIDILCPLCGYQTSYRLEPTEERPLVSLVRCQSCAKPFGVEVTLTVTVTVQTCRLALPSATPPDALVELETLREPEEEIPF
jgi:hypothetical protein